MSYSIIIPFFNEEETAREVLTEVLATNPEAEVIAVDDGSSDQTWSILKSFSPQVRATRFAENRGQSAAMYAGLQLATRDVVTLMDGDGQNDPASIPNLITELQKSQKDFVCGYRETRRDVASRRIASRVANGIRRAILHDGIRDTGCSLKAIKRECITALVPFDGMHRYIPALLIRAGYQFTEIAVNHRSRLAGTSKYTNWNRALRGVYDLIGVKWLLRRQINTLTSEDSSSSN